MGRRKGDRKTDTSAELVSRPEEEPKIIGLKIKALRRGFGLTLQELGLRTGVSPSYASRVEAGEINPTVRALSRMLGLFKISYDQFFGLAPVEDKRLARLLESVPVEPGSGPVVEEPTTDNELALKAALERFGGIPIPPSYQHILLVVLDEAYNEVTSNRQL
jgi:transcriptional regulator with XRE-family HTH domain